MSVPGRQNRSRCSARSRGTNAFYSRTLLRCSLHPNRRIIDSAASVPPLSNASSRPNTPPAVCRAKGLGHPALQTSERNGQNPRQVSAQNFGAPNHFVAEVHDRMPVILEAKDFEQCDAKDVAALMKPVC
jgi:hypothetical protein